MSTALRCRRCGRAVLRVRMEDGTVLDVNVQIDPQGDIAARRIGSRYQNGYRTTKDQPLRGGWFPFRWHASDCRKPTTEGLQPMTSTRTAGGTR